MSDAIEQTSDPAADKDERPFNGARETEFTVSPRRAVARARWAEIVFVAALGLYGVLAALCYTYAYFGWDLRISQAIQATTLPGFGQLMLALSALGNGMVPTML